MLLILGHLASFERDQVLRQVQQLAGIPDEDIPSDLMLNWSEARLLAYAPGFTIGCHTVNHERLSMLTDEEIRREIIESRHTIERELGIHVRFLSYPYGTWADIDKRTIHIVGDCGLDGAVTTLYGRNDLGSDAFVLKRVLGADTTGANFSIGTFIRGSWLGEPLRQLSRLTHQIF
jgi:peptidoglycan/xylan/chitin deacetylase (PgdA/CDA1 family)